MIEEWKDQKTERQKKGMEKMEDGKNLIARSLKMRHINWESETIEIRTYTHFFVDNMGKLWQKSTKKVI